MTTLNRPIVITEQDKLAEVRLYTLVLLTLVVIAFLGGKEIGRQEVQSKYITDLQDGKINCEVTTYSNKKEKFTEVRLGSISRDVGRIE